MNNKEDDMLRLCVGDLSSSSALLYQVAASLNSDKAMDRVAILTLEGALCALGKHFEELAKELDHAIEEADL